MHTMNLKRNLKIGHFLPIKTLSLILVLLFGLYSNFTNLIKYMKGLKKALKIICTKKYWRCHLPHTHWWCEGKRRNLLHISLLSFYQWPIIYIFFKLISNIIYIYIYILISIIPKFLYINELLQAKFLNLQSLNTALRRMHWSNLNNENE